MVCNLTAIDFYNFQNFLLRVASHPVLSFDRLFIGFLQLDEGWRDSIKDTGKTLQIFGSLEMIILILGLKVK
jgi:sorting nexin-4